MRRKRDEYGAIWGGNPLPEPGEELDELGLEPEDDEFCDVFDEDGDEVICSFCGYWIKWRDRDSVYICPACGYIYARDEFFNHIGATPPGPKCYTCPNLYPGCMICPYGYVEY